MGESRLSMDATALISSALRCGTIEAEVNVAPRLMELKGHPEANRLGLVGIVILSKLYWEHKLQEEEERFNSLMKEFLGLRELLVHFRNYARATREKHLYQGIYMVTKAQCDLDNLRLAELQMADLEEAY